ncbi:NUDIX hydrolase [Patescibacteria group bacterium]|nr:NUDIX hydrolase [Patescibacteria group bacterium]
MEEIPKNQPCPHCGRWANRGVSIDAVIIKNGKILLIQRGREPDKGRWGTPGGHVDWDESAEDAVRREVQEETGLNVISTQLVGVYSDPARHPKQVINLVYLAEVEDGTVKYGDDAMDARWYDLDSLPEEMALDHKANIQDARKYLSP